MKAQITLTPAESKRLIAKALLKHEQIKKALSSGVIVINLGSTNAFVAEELMKKELAKERFVAGMVDKIGTCVVPRKERTSSIVLRDGKISDEDPEKITRSMGPQDVFIKGANALDFEGNAGVMLASETGGTIGHVLGTLKARGVPIIIPVGLEKLIPDSIDRISTVAGIHQVDLSTGVPVGVMPLAGEIIAEKEAFELLGDVKVHVIGAGGIGGGEGSYTFLIEGGEREVKHIFNIVKEIKGEEAIRALRGSCVSCIYKCPSKK
ncbi:MAG: hypothetical protein ACE5HH_05760 [Candidatus Hydrothermarchaeales archaeon]